MKKFVACLAIFVVYATIASADPSRPRPQQVPPRPPHPRLRREADPGLGNPAHTYPTPRPPRFVREADPGVRTSLPKPTPHPRIRREADAEIISVEHPVLRSKKLRRQRISLLQSSNKRKKLNKKGRKSREDTRFDLAKKVVADQKSLRSMTRHSNPLSKRITQVNVQKSSLLAPF